MTATKEYKLMRKDKMVTVVKHTKQEDGHNKVTTKLNTKQDSLNPSKGWMGIQLVNVKKRELYKLRS